MSDTDLVRHTGGCHCRAVTWEIQAPSTLSIDECNCTICEMKGFQHLIVPRTRFALLTGGDNIATYTFNTGVAQHYFCKTCGVQSYYVPRSNPDGFSVNFRCLDKASVVDARIVPFDGRSGWEAGAKKLAHLSKD
ncbi:hypothetical protein H4S06_006939 [Coemansia sp. BCRC 34490]|nr:hypothetical protein H4S06_006939 [Coemansia sp. BCRC 34490]